MKKLQFACVLVLVLATSAAHAEEQTASEKAPDQTPLGGRGRLVIDLLGAESGAQIFALGALGGTRGFAGPLTFSSVSSEQRDLRGRLASTRSTAIGLAPSLDVFLTDRLSLGGRAGAGWLSSMTPDTDGYSLTAAPRVGYSIPLSSSFAFWPRFTVGYDVTRVAREWGPRDLNRSIYSELNLGVVVRASKHILFDFGPSFAYRHTVSEMASYGVGRADTTGFYGAAHVAMKLDF